MCRLWLAMASIVRFSAAVGALFVLTSMGVAHDAWADKGRALAVGSWATGHMTPLPSSAVQYWNQTLRQVVRTSIGSDRVRVCIAYTFGSAPLHIGSVHVGLAGSG